MEYRLENREFKARVELLVYRTLVDELRLNEDIVNYANQSFLRETGINLQVYSASLIFLCSSVYSTLQYVQFSLLISHSMVSLVLRTQCLYYSTNTSICNNSKSYGRDGHARALGERRARGHRALQFYSPKENKISPIFYSILIFLKKSNVNLNTLIIHKSNDFPWNLDSYQIFNYF